MPNKTTDLPHLMKSLSYVPSDDRVPQALRDGADEIERLRSELDAAKADITYLIQKETDNANS